MKRAPDRRQLRREYLKNKLSIYSGMFGALVKLLLTIVMALFLGTGAVEIFRMSQGASDPYFVASLIVGAGVVSFVAFSLYNFKCIVRAKQKAASLPYVPPVNASNLPSDEVLVRSADKPPAPVETLLRATQQSPETKPDELLRSGQGDRRV